ncbi:MAG: hypothetical protein KDC58_14155 [Cyclobacteriaceae bacterium]|nr:hypothetical protein [Cyclobacteriaceae bacterium]
MKTYKILLGAIVLVLMIALTSLKEKNDYSKLKGGLTKTEAPLVIE